MVLKTKKLKIRKKGSFVKKKSIQLSNSIFYIPRVYCFSV